MNIGKIGINNSFAKKNIAFTQNKTILSEQLQAHVFTSENADKIEKIRTQYSKLKRELTDRNKLGFVRNFNEEMDFLKEQEEILIRAFNKRGY